MRRNTVLNSRAPTPLYHLYYSDQVGSGISTVFRGREFQRGHGIGSIFSGLFRLAKPLFMRGAKAVGKQALRTGGHILDDLANGADFKDAFSKRLGEGGSELVKTAKRKLDEFQSGNGYKAKRRRIGTSCKRRVKRTTSKKKAKKQQKVKGRKLKRGKFTAKFGTAPTSRKPRKTKRTTKKKVNSKLAYNDIF